MLHTWLSSAFPCQSRAVISFPKASLRELT